MYIVNYDKYIVAADEQEWDARSLRDYVLNGDRVWWEPETAYKGRDEHEARRKYRELCDDCQTIMRGGTIEFVWCDLVRIEEGGATEVMEFHVKDLEGTH